MEYEARNNRLPILIFITILLHVLFLFLFLIHLNEKNIIDQIDKPELQEEQKLNFLSQDKAQQYQEEANEVRAEEGKEDTAGDLSLKRHNMMPIPETDKHNEEQVHTEELPEPEVPEQIEKVSEEKEMETVPESAEKQPAFIEQIINKAHNKKPVRRKILTQNPDRPVLRNFLEKFTYTVMEENEGNYYFSNNEENINPTTKQLKKYGYKQKIIRAIDQSLALMGSRKLILLFKNDKMKLLTQGLKIYLAVDIKKDGSISHKKVTSGIAEFDDFMNQVIENAAPFLPVPDHLNTELFKFNTEYAFGLAKNGNGIFTIGDK